MIQSIRQAYNAAFTPERYQLFLDGIEQELPGQLDFRVAETPVFVPAGLKAKLLEACNDIVSVLTRPDFKTLTENAIPAHQHVPNETNHTTFMAIDFAVCKDANGELTPQLIELQGFPSLYAFQPFVAEQFRDTYPAIPDSVSHLFTVADNNGYLDALRDCIVGDW